MEEQIVLYAPQKGQVTATLRVLHTKSNVWENVRRRTYTKENQLTTDTPEERNIGTTYNDATSKTHHYGDIAETYTTTECRSSR